MTYSVSALEATVTWSSENRPNFMGYIAGYIATVYKQLSVI